jgi:hypothetical protein
MEMEELRSTIGRLNTEKLRVKGLVDSENWNGRQKYKPNIDSISTKIDELERRREEAERRQQAVPPGGDDEEVPPSATPDAAILPSNISVVNEAIVGGVRDGREIASIIAEKEFSILSGGMEVLSAAIASGERVAVDAAVGGFIGGHLKGRRSGARRVAGVFSLALDRAIEEFKVAVEGGLLIGSEGYIRKLWELAEGVRAKTIEEHILVDAHFIEGIGLLEAVREYGSGVRLGEDGRVHLSVYGVMEESVIEGMEGKLKPCGIRVASGEQIYVGKGGGGIVVYAKGASREEISSALKGSERVMGVMKAIVGEGLGIKLGNIAIDVVEVDGDIEGIEYRGNGGIAIGIEEYRLAMGSGELDGLIVSLNAVKAAQRNAWSRLMVHDLDDIGEGIGDIWSEEGGREIVGRFVEYLSAHKRVGNGRIAVDAVILDRLISVVGEGRFKEFMGSAIGCGVEFYVKVGNIAEWEGYRNRELGLAGYIGSREDGRKVLYNEVLRNEVMIEEVKGFSGEGEMMEQMRGAGGGILLSNGSLGKVIRGERSGLGIREIVERLAGVGFMDIFRDREIDGGHIRLAVGELDISVIGEIDRGVLEVLGKGLAEGRRFGLEEIEGLGIISGSGSGGLSVLARKLRSDIGRLGEGRIVEMEELEAELGMSIVGKLMGISAMRAIGKGRGLEDKGLEIMVCDMALEAVRRGGEVWDEGYLGSIKVGAERYVIGKRSFREVEVGLRSESERLAREGKVEEGLGIGLHLGVERRDKEIKEKISPEIDLEKVRSIMQAA